jgi:hypothetical protein
MATYTVRQENAYLGADDSDERALIDIGDDEFVLDAEYRGANRVVVAVATPVQVTFTCEQCGKDFESEHGLAVHQGSEH